MADIKSLNSSLKAEIFWEHKDGMRVRLLESIVYQSKSGSLIIVPKDYVSDGGSIPKIFWFVLSPFENYAKSCILHDYLCDAFHKGSIKRKTCDEIFLESMEFLNIKKSTRLTLYYAVRLYAFIKKFK
ncbi:hypothetical protein BKH44_06095 [Helicobacter sp. 13S00477-4]|nr:hypothetical protein BKH44_06095 [Helicobacter sp. 13S00477-4]